MRKVGFFDIYVDDMDRAQAFYEEVLATKLSKMDDPNDSSVQMRARTAGRGHVVNTHPDHIPSVSRKNPRNLSWGGSSLWSATCSDYTAGFSPLEGILLGEGRSFFQGTTRCVL